jgi:hypothetical protein
MEGEVEALMARRPLFLLGVCLSRRNSRHRGLTEEISLWLPVPVSNSLLLREGSAWMEWGETGTKGISQNEKSKEGEGCKRGMIEILWGQRFFFSTIIVKTLLTS